MTSQKKLINHYCLLVDCSSSMSGRESEVIRVFDEQMAFLSKRSREMGQEGRITVYVFNGSVTRIIHNEDVHSLPSIRGRYRCSGNTALRDAFIRSQEDLGQTPIGFGTDHAFVTIGITDGEENSSQQGAAVLQELLEQLPDNWTTAIMVPNMRGKMNAEQAGFPKGNIDVWDINSSTGIEEASVKIQTVYDTHMTSRASGIRGSRTVFVGSAQQLNADTVKAANLTALDPDDFFLLHVAATGNMTVRIPKKTILKSRPDGIKHVEILEMVESAKYDFVLGNVYYELVTSEKVTGNKRIAVMDRATSKVYVGKQARALIGLDDADRRIRPMPNDSSGHPPFKIFVQSQSTTRLLRLHSQLLLLKQAAH